MIHRGAAVLLLSFVIACGHASRGGDDDSSVDSGATSDADPPGACSPTASFASERLPGYDAGSWYDGSVLHVADGVPNVLASERSPMGFTGGVVEWTRSAVMWDRSGIGASSAWLHPGSIATTTDGSLCVAYMSHDGALHIACDGLADRAVAPMIVGSLSITRIGTTAGVVYNGQDGALGGLLWQPFDGSAFDGNPGPAELIDGDYANLGTSSIAVDSLSFGSCCTALMSVASRRSIRSSPPDFRLASRTVASTIGRNTTRSMKILSLFQ